MTQRRFSTVGREFYPGYELKISCDRDTDFLDGEELEDWFRIVLIKEGHAIFRNGDNRQIVTSPTVLCLNEKDDAELCNAAGLKMDIMYFEPSCFELYTIFANLEVWKGSLNSDNWFFRPFFIRSETYIGACATNHYLAKRGYQLMERADKELNAQADDSWPCRSRSYFIELLLLLNVIYDEDSDHENVYYGNMTDEIRELINWLHIHYLEKMTIDMIKPRTLQRVAIVSTS